MEPPAARGEALDTSVSAGGYFGVDWSVAHVLSLQETADPLYREIVECDPAALRFLPNHGQRIGRHRRQVMAVTALMMTA